MTVKVTLEFPSIEASIAALGLLMKPKAAATASNAGALADAGTPPAAASGGSAPAAPATGRQRKPRADKGQQREPYGPRTEANAGGAGAPTGTGSSEGQVASAPSVASAAAPSAASPAAASSTEPAAAQKAPAEGDKPQPSGVTPAASAAGPIPSEADAQQALEKLFNATNIATSQEVMSRFGVKRLKELLPDARAEFIKLADETRVAAEAAKAKGGAA